MVWFNAEPNVDPAFIVVVDESLPTKVDSVAAWAKAEASEASRFSGAPRNFAGICIPQVSAASAGKGRATLKLAKRSYVLQLVLQPLRFRKRNGCNAECIVTRSLPPACSPVNHFADFSPRIILLSECDPKKKSPPLTALMSHTQMKVFHTLRSGAGRIMGVVSRSTRTFPLNCLAIGLPHL